ncbi:uncharacterized protein LOC130634855 isoform X1 [Hydractinia symbiolongicarpus]|uniref:uncharacterized protein LOC130634855 isoform X1 n=1 Tax=Hydractinia symbiolongicarpus TaxID=13093 RepID=UPI00254A9A75|nr:uncharacterized protein LOC130634855 isoform X1 [Hydractinia symbiolongicarpus]
MNASLVEFTMESYTEYTDEMDFISNQLTFGRKDFWVGLRDVNNSIFNWNTGYVSESSPWISTKKSASNLCGVLNSCGIQLINCQNRRPVICQKTSSVIYKTNWIQQDGISFYLSEVKVDYNTAKKICHAVNGSILEFTDECLPTDIPLSAQPYYIGLRYSNITDNFEWETTSLNETSFINHWPVVGLFQTGNCVVVNQKRIWEMVTCDSRYRFACKRATISSLFINNTNHCGGCPWKQLENKCYLNINENVTWDDAQAYCHSFQADLVVLNSTDESYFLGNMTGNQIFWVGAKNLHWINGQPYLNTFGASESSCVKFYHLNLSYSFCSENLPFVCQRNKNVVQDTSLFCNTPWILNGNSTCYLFSNKKATWKGAHSICRGYNAFLVAILDNDQHQFLINNAQFDTVGGYWTSYNDIESEGKFVWAAKGPGGGYQSWASGKPDDNDGVKNCVILQSDGWVDMKCNSKFHFICQKNGDFETPASIQRKHFYFHDTPMTYWKAEIIREGVYINENNYYEPKFSFLGQNGFIIVHQQLHGAGNFCLSHGSADVVNGSSPHIAEYNATTSKSCISFKFENRFFIFVDVNHTILCLQYVDSQLTFTDSCVYEVGFTNVSTNLELLSFQGENFTAKEIFYQIAGVDYVWSTDMLAPGEIIKNVGYKLLLNFKGYLTVNDSSNDVIYCLYLTQFDIKSPVKIGIMNDDAIDCIVFHFVDGFFRPAIFEYYGYCLQFSNDELYFTLECIYPAQIKDRNITSSIIFTSIASSFFTIPSTLYVSTSPLTSTESIQATIYSTELFATSSKFTTLNTKTSTLATSTPTHSTTQDSAHWAAWSEWLPCNVVCETGNRTRKRKCINAVESSQCFGSSTMYESCQGIGDCSKYAYTMRRSSCTEFCAETGQICDPLMHMGESISLFKILGFSCSDNSSQSEWKEDYAPYFHKDTKMCSGYKGLPENINCDAKPPSNRIIRLCKCILQDDIGMTEWSPWSSCSATCKGYHVRHRSCAVSGGDTCSRNKTHQSECNEHIPCPVHGGFTEWSVWSNCSKSCNKGERIRTRQCANPSPQNGGYDCHGVKKEAQACGTKRCPINGQWSSWSKLSACTKPCNG